MHNDREETFDEHLAHKRKELEEYGTENAGDIINAIRIDTELMFAHKTVEALEKELEKYHAHFHSFWETIKIRFGL